MHNGQDPVMARPDLLFQAILVRAPRLRRVAEGMEGGGGAKNWRRDGVSWIGALHVGPLVSKGTLAIFAK